MNYHNPIKVIGVGGGGSNAVNTMHERGIQGVDFIVCNTDAQALEASKVETKIQLGRTLTDGQGAGSQPEVGRNAAIESLDEVTELLNQGTRMVFVTAGMGGGTGTGAAPVIAAAAKELGILTVGIVTIPFKFEGRRRAEQAKEGLENMRSAVDTLLIIRNDKLRELYSGLTIRKAFMNADEVLCTAAKGIAEVITLTGLINVDMNDVNTVMRSSGRAIMGSGRGTGEGRAAKAVREALESPLLNDHDITGANFVLLNITFNEDEILMDEIMEITDFIQDAAGQSAEVIWGYGIDETLEDDISVTVIATGFQGIDEPENSAPTKQWLGGNLPPQQPDMPKSEAITPADAQEPFLKKAPESAAPTWNTPFEQRPMSPVEPPVTPPPVKTQWEMPEPPQPEALPEEPTLFSDPEPPVEETGGKVWLTLEDEPETPQDQAQPLPQPSTSGFTIRTVPNTPAAAPEPADVASRQKDRHLALKQVTSKFKTPQDLAPLENEPAYKRRKIMLDDVQPSDASNVSRYTLQTETDEEGNTYTQLSQNGFLSDQVD
jgi:cell division protein FtsZ